ncbi:GW domain-containing glycosaminoglycan-binding protein [Listeria seeligeri]|uniref:GW domain-containing glycosaminoglycan-binding protein n=1 Tax=Listeria seeligeri TaxID=1640 RepID=UPI001629F827|nr:GW domain-containing glycosaminoglycan-binding protein [Listeria seeligeri]MBC1729444.1 GW domain-containing glycosaminoglycan-binding protein [Listeria seeligeri]MBC1850147.1 GW domain-containing glycosaminoglycan-binding protein [Listeria seeligeri]MBC1855460.1 GW domain-containing glycosaminoglycan-binding protein [Listeria seeligeri]MBC1872366.1 GW domain-containing glycosaminoglycan-binding protein [Listeria seeligeri]MBC6170082.1 GW domain-containing glycosaminoglycan-binding protein 
MKKIVKSAVVFASLAFVGVSANMIPEKASASSINTVQKVDDQSVYIPEAVKDGTATENHDGFEDETSSVLKEVPMLLTTTGYPNVNSYIKTNKFSTAKIEKQLKSQFPKFNYRNGYGKPEGIVIHETANNSSTITGEINYMSNNYNNAFVHAFVDKSRIIQIHPTENGVWGAGQYANARFIQVELVRSKTFDEFSRSINNYAYYTAYLLNQYKLPVDNAHSDGKGTVWSHDAVTRYLGGTTHTDPVGYFNQWGYNFTDFVSLVNEKYKAMQVSYEKIEYDKAITAYSRVKTATGNSVWTKPNKTEGAKLVNPLSSYTGKNLRILREAKTPSAIWYQFSIGGKTIGWVDSKALNTFYTPSMEKVITGTRYVLPSKQNVHYYGLPVEDSAIDRGPLSKFNGQALTLQREATIEGQLWYRVKDLGWVKAANLTTTKYDLIEYDKAITAYSRVKTAAGNYVWTKPNKTEGAKQVGALSAYSGKNMRILREAKTPSAIWYQFSIDGKTIGWVDSKALDTFYTPSMEKNLTATRYVAPGKETQHYYGLPVADSAIDRGPLSKFAGQTLTVQREATIEGELWYRVKDLGWTKASTLTASQYDKIEYDKAITAYSRVKTATNNSVWTKPYRTSGYKLVNPLSSYTGKNMRIIREAKTSSGIWYQFSIGGKTIGWVDSKALNTFYTPSMEKVITGTRYVLPSKQNIHYYGLPVEDSAIDRGPLSKFNGQALTLQREATIEGQLWYRVKDLGWVKAANLSSTKYETIEYDKAITAYSRVKTASGNYVWTNPGKTEGAKQVSALSAYSGKNLRILREAKTASGVWYQFSVDGKTIGWVDTKALTTFYTPSMEKNLTATRYVAPGKETQHYYGLPVVDTANDRGPLSKFMGKTLTVQREATIEGELWYRVKDLGWTKASTLTASQYDKVEYDKATTAYSRVKTATGNSVWTKPYRTSGYKLVSPLPSYTGKNMRIIREAKTASGIWYQFSIGGKTIGWVDSKALNTFYTPSMEKNLTATRYVLASKQNEHYYGLPVVDSAIDRGPLSKFNGKTLTVQREATIEGQLWYRVKDLGWTKAANLSAKK